MNQQPLNNKHDFFRLVVSIEKKIHFKNEKCENEKKCYWREMSE